MGTLDPTSPNREIKALVLEDTQELAEILVETLRGMNFQAESRSHGRPALELFDQLQPDLMMLDIALPDMQGWKVLDAIKEKVQNNADFRLPKVIVITAYGDPANRLMGKLQDVSEYLIKPFTPTEIEKVVTRVMGLDGLNSTP